MSTWRIKIFIGIFVASGLFLISFIQGGQAFSVSEATRSSVETLEVLKHQSELVVMGQVVSADSHYGADARFPESDKIIVTDFTVQVRETLQGAKQDRLVVRLPGGCVSADHMCFETTLGPSLGVGESAILFLSRRSSDAGDIWQISDQVDGKQSIKNGTVYPLGLSETQLRSALGGGQ